MRVELIVLLSVVFGLMFAQVKVTHTDTISTLLMKTTQQYYHTNIIVAGGDTSSASAAERSFIDGKLDGGKVVAVRAVHASVPPAVDNNNNAAANVANDAVSVAKAAVVESLQKHLQDEEGIIRRKLKKYSTSLAHPMEKCVAKMQRLQAKKSIPVMPPKGLKQVPIEQQVLRHQKTQLHTCKNPLPPNPLRIHGRHEASLLWDSGILPGLNNMFYIAANYMYCGMKQKRILQVPDYIAQATRPRIPLSGMLRITIPQEVVDAQGGMCFNPAFPPNKAPEDCSWVSYYEAYKTPLFLQARRLIDFHPEYYEVAERFIKHQFDGQDFVALHVRRGDFNKHCAFLVGKNQPWWPAFDHNRDQFTHLSSNISSCYSEDPAEMFERTMRVLREVNARAVFIASNRPKEVEASAFVRKLQERCVHVVVGWSNVDPYVVVRRPLDFTLLESVVMSYGSGIVLNRYSSLSGTVYETAVVKGRAARASLYLW